MAIRIVIFAAALLSSYYAVRRVVRDVRDGDIIDDLAAWVATLLWTVFYTLNQ